MIEELLLDITNKVNLKFYRRIFSVVKEREGSLTAMEVFSLEVIHAMGEPTISEFAEFIGISLNSQGQTEPELQAVISIQIVFE